MVSKIRELCKQNKTSIAALERQLGFGNGVIGRWDKSVPNYDRLCAVANALGVSVSELTGETDSPEAKKSPAVSGEGDLGALIPGYSDLTAANKLKAQEYIALLLNSQQNT